MHFNGFEGFRFRPLQQIGGFGGVNHHSPRLRSHHGQSPWGGPAAQFIKGRGQLHKPFGAYSSFGMKPFQTPATERISYKEFEHTTNTQNTSLTITTKDGDVVTINLLEKEKASSRSSILKSEGRATGLSEGTEVDSVSLNKEKEESESASIGSLVKDGLFSGKATSSTESLEKSSGEYVNADDVSKTVVRYSDSRYSGSDFSFSVQGDLDEEELEAIASLVEDIDALSKEFFDGDVKVAFKQAKQIGYDDEEIAKFSLNLRETDTKVVAKSYEQSTAANDQSRLLESIAKPIGNHLHRIEKMESARRRYFEAESIGLMLDQLMAREKERTDVEEKVNEFMKFNKHMRGLLGFGK